MFPELRVRRVRGYVAELPLREPFRISGGSLPVRRSLIVELEEAGGALAWGECAPFDLPFYSAETVSTVESVVREVLGNRMIGATLAHPAELHDLLSLAVRGNRMARAGVETAVWDLAARMRGVPLAQLVTERLRELGVAEPFLVRSDVIRCGMALGIPEHENLDALASDIERAVEEGYHRIKIKVRPGWDAVPARRMREALRGTGLQCTVDANGAYEYPGGVDALRALDACDLAFIEQPLPEESWWDVTRLAEEIETPICLDESLTSDEVARQVVEMGGPLIWNLKIQRMGGLEESCRVYARGVAAEASLWVGTMPETGVGAQAALALAAHAGCVYPSDLEPSDRWYTGGVDLVPLVMGADGMMPVQDDAPPEPDRGALRLVFDRPGAR